MVQTPSAPAPVPAAGSMMARDALFVALAIGTLGYLVMLVRSLRQRAAAGDAIRPTLGMSIISFIANFFDTLGIGSYATTTSMVRQWKLITDERIRHVERRVRDPDRYPGVHLHQARSVDSTTLILMIVAAVLGAWLGAGVVSQWNRRKVQIGMGPALLGFAIISDHPADGRGANCRRSGSEPDGRKAGHWCGGQLRPRGAHDARHRALRAVPDPRGSSRHDGDDRLPIMMMGSCAFPMPFANVRFMRSNAYHAPSIMSMTVGGHSGRSDRRVPRNEPAAHGPGGWSSSSSSTRGRTCCARRGATRSGEGRDSGRGTAWRCSFARGTRPVG